MKVAFGPCRFDSDTRELRVSGEVVHLAPKALLLLETLLRRRPAAVSRDELYEILWPDTFVTPGSLDTVVSQVRVAIGDTNRNMIRTSWAFGFAFAAEAAELTDTRAASASLSAFDLVVGSTHIRLLNGENVVGRTADAAVQIGLGPISRHHATLTVSGDHVVIEDLTSKNGTFVNGRRIGTATSILAPAEIWFGPVRAKLVISAASDSSARTRPDATAETLLDPSEDHQRV